MLITSLQQTATVDSTIADAQCEMRTAYYGGAPGMLTSAGVWTVAGAVALRQTPERAVWALFVGGMLIHPLSVVSTKVMGSSGAHSKQNPLGTLALATTFWMIMCLPLAYGVSLRRIEWFFPAMLMIIGGRYLTFSTIFGTRLYWLCGGTLAMAGYLVATINAFPAVGAFVGAAIEAAFAIVIFVQARRTVTV